MSISGNRENAGRRLSTADLAAAGRRPEPDPTAENERAQSERAQSREERVGEQKAGDRKAGDQKPTDRTPAGPAKRWGETLLALITPELTGTYPAKWLYI